MNAEGLFSGPRLPVIAGPCVIESEDLTLRIADELRLVAQRCGVKLIFKASYDKANRTSIESYRGPGLQEGLRILRRVREEVGVPVLTDFHEPGQAAAVGEVVDVLQVPAFLCRQTDMLLAAAATRRTVNVKKGQFLSPEEVAPIVAKLRSGGAREITLTERGSSFGYQRLVVDFAGIGVMRELGCPIVFDATHSVQLPGAARPARGGPRQSGGRPEAVSDLTLAAAAVGVDALFLEVHPDPPRALSDSATSIHLDRLEPLLESVLRLREALRPVGTVEPTP